MSKILKEITAKENRKALRKAAIEMSLFLLMMFCGYQAAIYGMLYIWYNY